MLKGSKKHHFTFVYIMYFLLSYFSNECPLGDLWRHCGGLGKKILMPYPINQSWREQIELKIYIPRPPQWRHRSPSCSALETAVACERTEPSLGRQETPPPPPKKTFLPIEMLPKCRVNVQIALKFSNLSIYFQNSLDFLKFFFMSKIPPQIPELCS